MLGPIRLQQSRLDRRCALELEPDQLAQFPRRRPRVRRKCRLPTPQSLPCSQRHGQENKPDSFDRRCGIARRSGYCNQNPILCVSFAYFFFSNFILHYYFLTLLPEILFSNGAKLTCSFFLSTQNRHGSPVSDDDNKNTKGDTKAGERMMMW